MKKTTDTPYRKYVTRLLLLAVALLIFVATHKETVWGSAAHTPNATDCSAVSQIPESECLALISLYDATDGPMWRLRYGWKQTNRPCTSWYGVTCENNHVKSIELYNNRLWGNLPDLQLPYLTTLNLSSNHLNGSIPNFTGLGNVQDLNLKLNQLGGNIPDFTNLPHLQHLSLYGNQLNGNIPNFSGLPELQDLDLSYNTLSGSAPDLTQIPNLRSLNLSVNNLTGAIPDFSNLPNLETLDLSLNQFTSVPDFTNLPQLQALILVVNRLSGSAPEFTNLPQLEVLALEANQLSGSVPDFSNLPSLRELYLSLNRFTGSVPDFSNLPNLQILYLSDNLLTADIPDFSNIPNLQILSLRGNRLTGSVPDFSNLPQLQYLNLSNNQLTGNVPAFSNTHNLQELYLSRNHLSGSLPPFTNLTAFQKLDLANNQLSGTIPANLCTILPSSSTKFSYNMFDIYQTDPCIDNLQSQWKTTQTVPPTNIQATPLSNSAVQLSWDHIPYTGDGGYYEVMMTTVSGGPYTSAGVTSNKLEENLTVSGLTPEVTYYFVVRTFTPSHGNQPNDLTSDNSAEVAVALPAIFVHISTNGADAALDWGANTAFDHYEILYSEAPYFLPGAAGVTTASTTNTTWSHTAVAADVDHNYYYLARGVYADGSKSGVSNRNGEFTFGLMPGN